MMSLEEMQLSRTHAAAMHSVLHLHASPCIVHTRTHRRCHPALPLTAPRAKGMTEEEAFHSQITRSEAIQLTLSITAAETWQQLAVLYEEHCEHLWRINLAALYARLPRVLGDPRQLPPAEQQEFSAFYTRMAFTAGRMMRGGMSSRELCTMARWVGAPSPPRTHAHITSLRVRTFTL